MVRAKWEGIAGNLGLHALDSCCSPRLKQGNGQEQACACFCDTLLILDFLLCDMVFEYLYGHRPQMLPNVFPRAGTVEKGTVREYHGVEREHKQLIWG